MKHILICLLMFFLFLYESGSSFSQDPVGSGFFMALNDVPLMPGLDEIPDGALVFDKPEGRIVESLAITQTLEESDIQQFYSQTLPQLGWRQITKGVFVRQHEQLSLSIELENQYKLVRVLIEPLPEQK